MPSDSQRGDEQNDAFDAGRKASYTAKAGFRPSQRPSTAAESMEGRRRPSETPCDRTPLAERIRQRHGA
jgi:hypothetical protein